MRDPFGNLWWIQTHVRDVAEDEMAARMTQPGYLSDMQVSNQALDAEMRRGATGP